MRRARGGAVPVAAMVLSLVTVLALATACGGGTSGSPPASGTPTTPASSPAVPLAGVGCPSDAAGGRPVGFGAGLGGLVLGTGHTGVVLSHQSDGDLCQWLPYGKSLAQRGYKVLAFDFPGAGASTTSDESIDGAVAAAAAFLRKDGATKVVLIGASMGGTASVAAAAQITPPVAGVISLSGPTTYSGTSAIDAAPKLTVPALFVVAEDDPTFVSSAHLLYEATPTTVARKLLVLPSGGHGVLLLNQALGAPAAPEVTKFLARYAPPG